jgi:tetratricopeptide (TPR) repeat protein
MARAAAARIDAIEQEIALDLRAGAATKVGVSPSINNPNQVNNRTNFSRVAPPKGIPLIQNSQFNTAVTKFPDTALNFNAMPGTANTLLLGDTNFNAVIEVKEVHMAPAVEEAAVLYANGQLEEAINLLLAAFKNKKNLGNSEFNAYRVLFDLLRYKGDSDTFDRYAIDFATRFEKSPPAWELPKQILAIPLDNIPTLDLGDILDASIVSVLEQLKVIALHSKRMRIDVGNISNINYTDGFGCELLMRVLTAFENTEYQLELVGTQHLFQKLRPFIQSKQPGISGHLWLLYLEMLRMQNQQLLFEDISIKFSQQYEVSPPSWQAPAKQFTDPVSDKVLTPQTIMVVERPDNIKLSGEIRSSGDSLINQLAKGLQNSPTVVCDCRDLRLVDFQVAERLLSALAGWSSELKTVEFKNLSNPIATLFVVLGIQHLAVVERRRDA